MAAPDWNLMLAALLASLPVCATPGPNNIVCASIGAQYGARRALPYSLGVTLGFPLLLGAAGAGLGTLLRLVPQLHLAAKTLGVLFLVYLAARIAFAPARGANNERLRQAPGFVYAVLFQWVNPKAISFSLSLTAVYARPEALPVDIPLLMLMSALITLPVTMGWALMGNWIARFLQTPLHHRIFNGAMGALLLAAALSILGQ